MADDATLVGEVVALPSFGKAKAPGQVEVLDDGLEELGECVELRLERSLRSCWTTSIAIVVEFIPEAE